MTTVLVVAILALALLGAPIFMVFMAIAMLGMSTIATNVSVDMFEHFGRLSIDILKLATGDVAITLSTIPLFIFAGAVMAESRAAERLVNLSKPLVGWIPGGLGVVTILVCAVFTTFTGASGVTIVAMGGMLLPELVKQGYDRKFSLGLITGTGSVGLLFPPALPLFIYGSIYAVSAQTSLQSDSGAMTLIPFSPERFALEAGLVPGLILIGAISLYVVFVAWRRKVPTTPFDGRAAARAFVIALPEVLLPALVILGLKFGIFQIPSAAAFAALYVLVIEVVIYRDVKLTRLPHVARSATSMVGAIFLVIVGATVLTQYFTTISLADRVFEFISTHIHAKWAFLLALNGMLLVVGFVMEIFSAILVVVPLITPVAYKYGIDPYHLGVIFLLNLEIGYLHPPVGLNLLISSYRFRRPIGEVVMATLPFLFIMAGVLLLVTYVPGIMTVRDPAPKPAATQAAGAGAGDGDAGAPVTITWPDGGVWTAARCDAPEIKDDPLALAECKNVFTSYAKCAAIEDKLDRLECEQRAMTGETADDDEADGGAPDAGVASGDGGLAPADAGATP